MFCCVALFFSFIHLNLAFITRQKGIRFGSIPQRWKHKIRCLKDNSKSQCQKHRQITVQTATSDVFFYIFPFLLRRRFLLLVFAFSFVNRVPKAKNEAIHLIGFSSIVHHTTLHHTTSHHTEPHKRADGWGVQRISHTKWFLSTFTLIEFFTSNTTAAHRRSTIANK